MHTLKSDIKKIGRLQKRPNFLRVAKEGKKWTSKSLILQAAPNNLGQARFGLTVTKKISKSAVVRNRIRRRLRAAAFEILPGAAKPGYDYVLIGRHETEKKDYTDLTKDLRWCLKRLELLTE